MKYYYFDDEYSQLKFLDKIKKKLRNKRERESKRVTLDIVVKFVKSYVHLCLLYRPRPSKKKKIKQIHSHILSHRDAVAGLTTVLFGTV